MRTLLSFIALLGFTTTKLSNALIDLRPIAKKIDVKKIKVRITGYWPGEDLSLIHISEPTRQP
jgi:hypothetical protein